MNEMRSNEEPKETITLEEFEKEVKLKNQAYYFILEYELQEIFRVYCKHYPIE